MGEHWLRLAQGITARVLVPEDASLALVGPVATSNVEPCITLRATLAELPPSPPQADEAQYWGLLRWVAPQSGDLQLPSGRGTVSVNEHRVPTVDVELNVASPERGFGSALRLCLALSLAARGGFLVHAGSSLVDGRAILLLGPSGAGKTTSARRLGREGAARLADDLVVIRYEQQQFWVEVCQFDRAARLPERRALWPLTRAYNIEKAAMYTRCTGFTGSVLSAWTSALFMPAPQPVLAGRFLDGLSLLAHGVGLRTFHAAPRGSLLAAVRVDLSEPSRRS